MFEYLHHAIGGPGTLRFIIQPLVALLLGVRDGIRDAKKGASPYGYGLLTAAGHRKELLMNGVRQVLTPLCIGFGMDVILRFSMGYGIHLLSSALVGGALIGLPYLLSRGVTNRIVRGRYRGRNMGRDHP